MKGSNYSVVEFCLHIYENLNKLFIRHFTAKKDFDDHILKTLSETQKVSIQVCMDSLVISTDVVSKFIKTAREMLSDNDDMKRSIKTEHLKSSGAKPSKFEPFIHQIIQTQSFFIAVVNVYGIDFSVIMRRCAESYSQYFDRNFDLKFKPKNNYVLKIFLLMLLDHK